MSRLSPEERAAIEAFPENRVTRIVADSEPTKQDLKPLSEVQYPERSRPRPSASAEVFARSIGIERALVWAFRDEAARLAFPGQSIEDQNSIGWGLEWMMIQQAKLGCRVDRSTTHQGPDADADIIADTLAVIADYQGLNRIAIDVAELARANERPDAMIGAVPKLQPKSWRKTQGKWKGRTEPTGESDLVPKRVRFAGSQSIQHVYQARIYTPCIWSPSLARIESARRRYSAWWTMLDDLRKHFRRGLDRGQVGLLRIRISNEMPPARPWEARGDD